MRLPAAVLALAGFVQAAAPAPPVAPPPREIAPQTWLLPGAMLPGRGPDGNTVVLRGPDGLVVVDTGRHTWHSDGILAFARAQQAPVQAIVNTHWHLDHASGNGRLKAAHPQAKVYTTRAVDRALGPDGFLTRNAATARNQALPATAPATQREEVAIFLATMDAADVLRPDVAVERPADLTLAGRPLAVRVAADAVTDADLWLFDAATGTAVLGDLVTLPAPFFETACPARWQAALDDVWATPFRLAVPGHGAPMTRAEFDQYRRAFTAFRACAAGDGAAAACADAWTRDVATLLPGDRERVQASEFATYYVGFLRKNGGASPDCRAK
jgi:glyoxylase-like metal-dependent hydrolase (beta-lactamase superfamily II)